MMKPLGHENDSEYETNMENVQVCTLNDCFVFLPLLLSLRRETQFELQASKCSFAMLFGKQLATSNAH